MPNSKVIVLDNGHGGSNEGLNYRGFVEKDMNLIVANAMKDALSQFDNVEVYITNPDKKDMSLKERAQYAENVGADVIICLHFNMSEEHTMYGSETWIPSKGLGYAKMHSLGDIFMDQFYEEGLTIRGVKTRLKDNGEDYYGIIRESALRNIPCILVEHAHADHDRDLEYIDSEADLKHLGELDAQAVAKFYHLSSESLGIDYTNFVKNGYYAPEEAVGSDFTPPQEAVLIWNGTEGIYTKEDVHSFLIGAKEQESTLVYYDYSLDGGKTWSELFPFERNQTQMKIEIPGILPGSQVTARIYNGHYLYTMTNVIYYEPFPEQEDIAGEEQGNNTVTGDTSFIAGKIESRQEEMQEMTEKSDIKLQNSLIAPVLYGGFGIFLAGMLILAAILTARMGDKKRYFKRIQMLFTTGISVLLISVTVVGIGLFKNMTQMKQVDNMQEMEAVDSNQNNTWNNSGDFNADQVEVEPIPREDLPFTLSVVSGNGLPENLPGEPAAEQTTVVYDIAEGYLRVPLLENVKKNPYQLEAFHGMDLEMRYQGEKQGVIGIDVSKFQGNIDYTMLKDAGINYVMVRLGLRGYGSGSLVLDERFHENMTKAQEAGLRTGVYFFSAAITTQEAVEEARFVVDALSPYTIDMPVVFDTEPILHDIARTDDLTPNELTKITKAFCEEIKASGYKPMIYANAKRFTTVLHLEELAEYDLWLADYRQAPDFPYAFQMWQYTEHGKVPGIDTEVDLDLYFEE